MTEIDTLYQEFKITGKQEIKEQIEELKKQAEIAKKEYEDFINELVEFDDEKVKRIEADMLGKIKLLTGKLAFITNNEEVSKIDISRLSATNEEINKALVLAKYFNSLQELGCSHNPNLESLPKLPDGLKVLYCTDNPNPQFKSLPKLPDSLQVLRCHHTKLESLPKLPDSLERLYCSYNPKLKFLPKLPDGLKLIDLENTPAAKNPEVIEQLKNFKARHPSVTIKGVDLS
jgi:hypothetical protein